MLLRPNGKAPETPDWRLMEKLYPPEKVRAEFEAYALSCMTADVVIPCPKHGRVPVRFTCRHVVHDRCPPEDHVGIVCTDKGYYVCKTCWKLIEQHKFKFATEIGTNCRECILELAMKLLERNPELIVDNSQGRR